MSTNFSSHPEGRFARPVLANLDREQFETFCYSSTGRPDPLTGVLRGLCDGWRDARGLSDAKLADRVRDDHIDILVDLTGHFGGGRMGCFARRPAPVQVIHFGYPGTSGLAAVDWRVTDRFADPPDVAAGDPADGVGPYAPPADRLDNYTTERLIGVAGGAAWCYDPPAEARAVGPPPALKRGYVTFACVNNPLKVSGEAVRVWADVLRAVPGSRLEILGDGGRRGRAGPDKAKAGDAAQDDPRRPAAGHLLGEFARHGVEPGRVVLVPRQGRGAYFDWIHSADVALDPWPYNGGVTTCDTLWMGVPVVSLAGGAYWSRQGVMLLGGVGLGELAAPTAEAYVRTAVELAKDVGRLAGIRRALRDRLRAAAVCDAPAFARRLGDAYRAMWRLRG